MGRMRENCFGNRHLQTYYFSIIKGNKIAQKVFIKISFLNVYGYARVFEVLVGEHYS